MVNAEILGLIKAYEERETEVKKMINDLQDEAIVINQTLLELRTLK